MSASMVGENGVITCATVELTVVVLTVLTNSKKTHKLTVRNVNTEISTISRSLFIDFFR